MPCCFILSVAAEMSDILLISSVFLFARLLPLVVSWNFSSAVIVVMKVPCLLLADSWYRGWYDVNSVIFNYLVDNGWWNNNWPACNLDYIRYIGRYVYACSS